MDESTEANAGTKLWPSNGTFTVLPNGSLILKGRAVTPPMASVVWFLQLPSQHLLLQVRRGHVLQGGVHPVSPQPPLHHPLCRGVFGRPQPVCHRHPVRLRGLVVHSAARAEEVRTSVADTVTFGFLAQNIVVVERSFFFLKAQIV